MEEPKFVFQQELYQQLDSMALLARQDFNFGGNGKWFSCFRGGIHGLNARMYGAEVHFYAIYKWIPEPENPVMRAEYHLSSILFNMDSAVECLVYALNALGWAVEPSQFHDVTSARGLRRVAPSNILGGRNGDPQAGYAALFPSLQTYWQSKSDLIHTITEHHDVSKHRETVFTGGAVRLDPPPGFFESLGIDEADEWVKLHFRPMKEVLLVPNPKSPPCSTPSHPLEDCKYLKEVVHEFCEFINVSGEKVLGDVSSNLPLQLKSV